MNKTEGSKRDSFADLVAHAGVTVLCLTIGYLVTFLVIEVAVGMVTGGTQNSSDPTLKKWVSGVGAIVSTFIATYITRVFL